jgi:DNA-binding CsgD family transcriptional regulator
MLVGREKECLLIDNVVAATTRRGAALVVTGEPGVGKTALLDYAARTAAESLVLRTRGVESETILPFAALADVLLPLREYLATLPSAQRAALEVCLALSPGSVPDTYAVCAGALSLLSTAAAERPILLLVDDLQWIDPCSRRALLFVGRRVTGEQIAIVFAVLGQDHEPAEGLPSAELAGLAISDCAELLRRQDLPAAPRTVTELAAWSGGNPLALLEAAASLTPSQLRGEEPMPRLPAVGSDLEQAWLTRIGKFPRATRDALAIVAASHSPSITALEPALDAADLSLATLTAAEEAGLISEIEDGYEFRHPVLRSVIMRRTPLAVRRRTFRILADVSSGSLRAWYLAAAAAGPDENVARSLVAAAQDGRRRGAYSAAARTWRRAADVTPDRGLRADRLLQAASDAFLGGSSADATMWCEEALSAASDPLLRADIELLRGRVRTWLGHPGTAHPQLVDAANAVRAVDPQRACALFAEATLPAAMDNQVTAALKYAEECRDLAVDSAIMSLPGSVLYGSILVVAGRVAEGRATLDKWAAELTKADPIQYQQLMTLAAQACCWSDNEAVSRELLTRVIDTAQRNGAPAALPIALGARSELDRWRGRWATAYADATEALRWAEELQHTSAIGYALACLARLDAYRGDRALCEERIARARRDVGPFAIGCLEAYLTSILGIAALIDGEYDTAVAQLERTFSRTVGGGMDNPMAVPYIADLAEAYIRSGKGDRAAAILDHVAEQARATGLAWPEAAAARGRMLMATTLDEAESWFAVAESAHRRRDMPFEHARTLLCSGEVLRRYRRPTAARRPLLAAHAAFESLGATSWAGRAAAELAATGRPAVTISKANLLEQLTAQELQVARTIARGMSNNEAASALFVSRKTIEAHLTHVYRKLAVRSRTDLARALVTAGLVD